MTIASLHKHSSIWTFLSGLSDKLGWENYQVVDHWDADLHAIGVASLKDPARLVYVSTFQQMPGRYAFECEVSGADEMPVAVQRGPALDLDGIVEIIRSHLKSPAASR